MMKKNSDGRVLPHMLRHYFATDVYNKTKDIAFENLLWDIHIIPMLQKQYISTQKQKTI